MLTRRHFVAATLSAVALPGSSFRQSTPIGSSSRIPLAIWSEGVNASRTRYVAGAHFDGQPVPHARLLEDASFEPLRQYGRARILVSNGYLVALGNNVLYAVDVVTGTERWNQSGVSNLIAASDGLVVFAFDGTLTCANIVTGEPRWDLQLNADQGANVVGNALYVRSSTAQLHALNIRSGESMWTAELIDGERIFVADERVIVGCSDGPAQVMSAWDATSGERLWQEDVWVIGSSVLLAGSTVIAGGYGNLVVLDALTGSAQPLQTQSAGAPIQALALSEDRLVAMSINNLFCYQWPSGDLLWNVPLINGSPAYEYYVTADHVIVSEFVETGFGAPAVARAYDVATGERVFEVQPLTASGARTDFATFAIGNGEVYFAGDSGISIFLAGDGAFVVEPDPLANNTYHNDEFGFSYSWPDGWTVVPAEGQLPHGFGYTRSGSSGSSGSSGMVAQYVAEATDSSDDLVGNPPVWFSGIPDSIEDVQPIDVPTFTFDLPADATATAAGYRTSIPGPFSTMAGLRIRLPLRTGDDLIFEYTGSTPDFETGVNELEPFITSLHREGVS